MTSPNVLHATDTDYEKVVADAAAAGKPVLVDFWAEWCGPCRQVAPILDQLADEHPEFAIVKVDIDQATATAQAHGVMSVPTLVVLDTAGTPVERFAGPKPKAALAAALAKAV